jgi:anti-sigma factor RsiW
MISEHPDDIILLDYVEGMLQGQASDSVRRHIATCRACRRTLAELSDTVMELERLPTAEIPHDSLGRTGRAGMLRALARFVPVLLAATALVCAILFTRSGAGRRHDAPQKTTKTRTPALPALPATMSRQTLHYNLVTHYPGLTNVIVNRLPWTQGFIVLVPSYDLAPARAALRAIASRKLPSGSTCTTPVPGQCVRVVLVPLNPAPQTPTESLNEIPVGSG